MSDSISELIETGAIYALADLQEMQTSTTEEIALLARTVLQGTYKTIRTHIRKQIAEEILARVDSPADSEQAELVNAGLRIAANIVEGTGR